MTLLKELESMGVQLVTHEQAGAQLSTLALQSSLMKFGQTRKLTLNFKGLNKTLIKGSHNGFLIDEDGSFQFQNSLCMPNKVEIKKQILEEAYNSCYSVHPNGTKMYRDMRQYFWRNNMKKEIAEYVDKCLTYQKVKAEHQRHDSMRRFSF